MVSKVREGRKEPVRGVKKGEKVDIKRENEDRKGRKIKEVTRQVQEESKVEETEE